MFGPRLNRIFASRWVALWWAASILFLAWQFVPSPDDSADGADSKTANGTKASAAAAPAASAGANPWSLDKPAKAAD